MGAPECRHIHAMCLSLTILLHNYELNCSVLKVRTQAPRHARLSEGSGCVANTMSLLLTLAVHESGRLFRVLQHTGHS